MKAGKNGGNLEIEFFICFLFTIFKHLSEVEMHFESNINDAVFGKRFYIVEINTRANRGEKPSFFLNDKKKLE